MLIDREKRPTNREKRPKDIHSKWVDSKEKPGNYFSSQLNYHFEEAGAISLREVRPDKKLPKKKWRVKPRNKKSAMLQIQANVTSQVKDEDEGKSESTQKTQWEQTLELK